MDTRDLLDALKDVGIMVGIGAGAYIIGMLVVILLGKMEAVGTDASLGIDANISANVTALAGEGITNISNITGNVALIASLFAIVVLATAFGAKNLLKKAFSGGKSKGM